MPDRGAGITPGDRPLMPHPDEPAAGRASLFSFLTPWRLKRAVAWRVWPWKLAPGARFVSTKRLTDAHMEWAVERSRREGWKDITP